MSNLTTQLFTKNAAYCAIFTLLTGCSTQNLSVATDSLSNAAVRERANAIENLSTAQTIEQSALSWQSAADATLINIEAACLKRFLVNKCIESAQKNRNELWDAAQHELTAARLYIRTDEANKNRTELNQKLAKHQADELANIPVRAANVAAFNAKQAAYAQRQVDYVVKQVAMAPERAANVTAFEDKQLRIEELKKKRTAENAKRTADAIAKREAENPL